MNQNIHLIILINLQDFTAKLDFKMELKTQF